MFTLTEDEKAINSTARDFADEFLAPNAVEWDQNKHFPVDVLRKAAGLGMGGIYVDEEVGGSGLTRVDAARIFEQLATGDPSLAAYISIHNMVTWMIDTYGTDEQRRRWVPGLCSMDQLGSYCLTEPGAGSDASALSTKAVRDGDDYVLNGVKQFISGAGTSDVYVVMVRTGDAGPKGISAIIVPKDSAGLSFGANEKKMGWNAQPTRQVIFEDVRVPAANLLGGEGEGFRIAMNGLNGGRLNIAACSIGGAQSALEKAVAYLLDRKAFGSRLLDQQALQFQLADMKTELEAARTMLWRAADALQNNAPDKVELCAMAKRFATDTGFEVANDALQLLGGYGYLAEYGVEKIVRDLRVHQILEGTNEIMRVVVARSIVGAA
ncbi:acyl-CoA dehydrogenase family protein [Rhodococcus sp. BP-252]|uniref:isobutyryl-CoA dehydrogenase n=1 Tax=unclassified Rhodococcus (in: high G+C Gram-positive bacteria) TaxID=192944 RepID=UPI001C9AF48F|nr:MULTISPECIES: isobutyryl-CoA dehydrogenase [unclassified Rhodococcus (in: high G+C Gram-positive bacteria)]MBY6413987.1 acyl-CoA dehydrogenase family protein [Rhodococcus sp. BP-320]MBY6418780.1 acyl-CoA dehydrogenase family protein [Rhodococcus sp. BP-321]MBY6423339.1 acyl-CoA dehydrogenase family protein [Rhodococcus sp. BP-324]MBY6428815.1 acyl-CoA dehydrogenase family protein [Rhodococcus sp. BP-323]MBY6433821.1 acyl-CoA dehydrogenase family protein [Rhodococcus sp. BP-322]